MAQGREALVAAGGREEQGRRLLVYGALALLGTALLTASAKVQVPFWPVPMTMQTAVVLALGATFGWRLGLATVLLYLAEGAAGLPVFAGTPARGIGLAHMAGPTGGYLVGFALACVLMGVLAERGWLRSVPRAAAAAVLGIAAIYACGAAWLAALVGPEKAIAAGVLPFLPGDFLKVLLLAVAVPPLRRWLTGMPRR